MHTIILPEHEIRDICAVNDSDCLRLTFRWPVGVEQVYVFRTDTTDFDITTAAADGGKLLTLHEYKRRGGYIQAREPGIFTYFIYPFLRNGGRDVCVLQTGTAHSLTCRTGFTTIRGKICKKWSPFDGDFVTYALTLQGDYPIPGETLCYVKSPGGTVYPLYEAIGPEPLTRHVLVKQGEEIIPGVLRENERELYQFNIEVKHGIF